MGVQHLGHYVCPVSATAALGGGGDPSCPVPGCHSGQADSALALLLPKWCHSVHFLFSVFDVAIYWFSRNLEPNSHLHQLLRILWVAAAALACSGLV